MSDPNQETAERDRFVEFVRAMLSPNGLKATEQLMKDSDMSQLIAAALRDAINKPQAELEDQP